MGSERRNCARRVLYSPEYLDMGADNGGVVVDLGEGGLRFQAVGRVEPNSDVPLSFSLGTGYRIDVEAHVVWVSPRGNSGGVAFKKLSNDSRSLIREWLAKPEAEHRAEAAIATAEGEEERQVPLPDDVQTASIASAPAAPSLASEGFNDQPREARVQEAAAPDDPLIRTHFEGEPHPALVSQLRTAVMRASAAPTGPAAVPSPRSAQQQRTPATNLGSSFSAVPSISAWGGKSSPNAHLSSRVNPLESESPLFPPRGAENVFGRNRWQAAEIEERHPVRNFFLIVLALVIVGAVLIGVAWERGYRQEIGAAIERVGSTVAGETDSGTSSTPASASAPSPSTSGAASTSSNTPAKPSPAADAPSPGAGTAAAATLPQSSVPNAPAPNSPSAASSVALPPNSSASAKQSPAEQNSPSAATGKTAQTPPAVPPQNLSAPANLKQASSRKPPQGANASAPSSADLAQGAAQSEFLRAQQYLTGSGVPQDPATAAEWFWRSLEAGNTAAAIPLADLYIAGNGVSRSCEQARILLDTAARKGNAEAAHKLVELPANCD